MNETYLLLIGGVVAGVLSAVIGGLVFYGNLLRTRAMLQNRVEREKIALYNDISEFDEKEFLGTEAGKNLVALLKDPDRDLNDPLENFGTGLRRHNRDLAKQLEEARKKLAQSEQTKQALGVAQSRITDLEKSNKDLLKQLGTENNDSSTAPLKMEKLDKKDLYDILLKAMDTGAKGFWIGEVDFSSEFATSKVSMYADRNTLKKIFVHLLQNAIAASPVKGSVNLRMQIEVDSTGTEYVVFLVSDKGGGVEPTDVPRVFTGGSNRIKGVGDTGALSTAKTLTDAQKGDLRLTRIKGGTVFSVRLPIVKRSATPFKMEELDSRDLEDIVAEVITSIRSEANAKNIQMSVGWMSSIQETMYADREALIQVLVYLMQNAIAVTPSGKEVFLQIEQKADGGKYFIVLQVSDEGGGIAPADEPRLYTGGSDRIKGVGDPGALSTAKTLTDAQQGRIEFENIPNVGSIFKVKFPISPGTDTAPLKLEKLDKKDLNDILLKAMDTGAKGFWIGEVDFSSEFATNEVSMYADRKALKKIFVHLLQNAIAASPGKGSVKLRMQIEVDMTRKEYLVFQVSNEGGEIDPADMPRVFTHAYSPNSLIKGVGETGTGLSTAMTLAKAQKGDIGVKRAPDGAIFSVRLPIAT